MVLINLSFEIYLLKHSCVSLQVNNIKILGKRHL